MLTKVKSAALTGNDRLTEIANLLADAIIARDAQIRLSARPSKVLSESPDRSVDSVSELRLSVTGERPESGDRRREVAESCQ